MPLFTPRDAFSPDDRAMMVAYIVWSAELACIAALSWLLWAGARAQFPGGASPAPGIILWGAGGAALWNFAGSIWLFWRGRAAWNNAVCAVLAGLAFTGSPVVLRILLPWEDPATGDGSPMAVFLGIVALTVLLGVVAILPGLCGVLWLVARKDRIIRSARAAPGGPGRPGGAE